MNKTFITRPPLAKVLATWQECLAQHQFEPKALWIFAENVCVEPARGTASNVRLGFQTKFTPPADDALEIAYNLFGETQARMVFYRLGTSPRGSVCILLCDAWFEQKKPAEGYERHDEWGISFYPGQGTVIDEVTDLSRWLKRVKRGNSFHDFDFAMSLATIDEVKIHGRTLHPYERLSDNMLNRLRRVLGNPT